MYIRAAIERAGLVDMRVAVLAGSIRAGMRIAGEIENLPGIDVFVIVCNVGMRSPLLRWSRELFSAFRLGILNAHIGILPKYRGRCVVEWSVLQGDPTGVTVFFIDSGIDTGGRIVLREFIPSNGWKRVGALKNMLFGCDARLYRKALEALMQPGVRFEGNEILKGKRYYVMSKMFVHTVDRILRDRAILG